LRSFVVALILILFVVVDTFSQSYVFIPNRKKNTLYVYPTVQFNEFGIDLGAGLGLTVDKAFYVSVLYKQTTNSFENSFNHYNLVTGDVCYQTLCYWDWCAIGFGTRIGFTLNENRGLYLEPYVAYLRNSKKGLTYTHSVGSYRGLFTYTYSIYLEVLKIKNK